MRKLIYVLLLAAAFLTPEKKQDIGRLLPVEVVSLRYEDDLITIETDTGELGQGIGMAPAIANLKETTAGVIYLDTAAHLLVSPEAVGLLPDLAPYLKKDVRVYTYEGELEMSRTGKYLAAHRSPICMEEALRGKALPVLIAQGERFLTKTENKG